MVSLALSKRYYECLRRVCGYARGYELRSSVQQLVQHLAFCGAVWRGAQAAAEFFCPRFPVIRYLETISPLVLRAFTQKSAALAFDRSSARSRTGIS